MKRISILVVLFLMLAVSVLPAAAIIGGELDGDRHPNVGIMIAEEELADGGVDYWRCSGTLVAPRVFLTAGHCVHGMRAARVWFENDVVNIPDYPLGGVAAYEGRPIPHPDFGWGVLDAHDVGVVLLNQPVTGVAVEPLPEPDLLGKLKKDRILRDGSPEGAFFTVVGYGVTLVSWPPPLQDNNKIRQVAESQYVALTKPWLHLSQRAVFEERGTCGGDSGGPVYWVDNQGNETIVAVTSWGDPGCVATGFYYRVDTPKVLEWIYQQFPED